MVLLLSAGCGSDPVQPCLSGEVTLCNCPNGARGHQACQPNGAFESCQCEGGAAEPCAPGAQQSCECGGGVTSTRTCAFSGQYYEPCMCGGGTGGLGGTGSVGGSGGMAAPVVGPGTVITDPQDDAAFVWDQSQVATYELQIEQSDLDFLDAAPSDEIYVPAKFTYGAETYDVGVRYKGSVGGYIGCVSGGGGLNPLSASGRKTCPKLSMKVRFNWTNNGAWPDGGRFHGLKKMQFHSMNSDPSMLRDRLGYAIFSEMGMASPRSAHARLMVNGQYEGLFIIVEQIDSRFLRAHFTDGGDGNLYKEIWPKWTGGGDYTPALRTNENDPGVNFDRVIRFAQQVQGAAGPVETLAVSSQWMDINYVYKFIAVDRAIVHDDGMFHWYCGGLVSTGNNPGNCSNHNYYWYEGQSADYLWLIPWDLDLSFGGDDTGFTRVSNAWNDTNVQCPSGGVQSGISGGQMPPGCDKLTAGWASDNVAYKAAIQELLAGPFSQANVDGKINAWSAQITDAVNEQAQQLSGGAKIPSANAWQTEVNNLRQYVNGRRSAMQQLAN